MDLGSGLPFIAEGALVRGTAVMAGTAYPQVKPTTGANVKVLGYALCAAADGQEVSIHPVTAGNAKCKAIASATIARGDSLISSATTGALKSIAASSTLKYGAGMALEAAITGQLFDILPAFFESAVTT